MNNDSTTVTREELYDLVWSTPMRDLAKRFGISDVGLAKRCRGLKIPMPGRGYWAKKQAGLKVDPRPPLPTWKESWKPDIVIHRREGPATPPTDIEGYEEGQRLIASEKDPVNTISVKQTLHNPHPLIVKTQQALKGIKPDTTGLIVTGRQGVLEVRISPSGIPRALRIMDALIKALEKRGFQVTLKKETEWQWSTRVSILGEDIAFALWEGNEAYEPVLTPAQQREKEKYPFMYDRAHYRPSGKLSLRIRDSYSVRRSDGWEDNDKKKVEERLNTFVMALIRKALREKMERMERQKREREWQERRRLQEEQERQRREQQARLEKLEQEVTAWNKSQLIREYVEAVGKAAEKQGADLCSDSELSRWITWARGVADWLDPSERKAQELLRPPE
jgi:hypothetical protein